MAYIIGHSGIGAKKQCETIYLFPAGVLASVELNDALLYIFKYKRTHTLDQVVYMYSMCVYNLGM